MIVQCTECMTRFNLDESRLRGDSAKVRCSKCRHVFMIQKPVDDTLRRAVVENAETLEAPFTFDSFSARGETPLTDIDSRIAEPFSQPGDAFDIFGSGSDSTTPPFDSGKESGHADVTARSRADEDLFSFADVAPPDTPAVEEEARAESAHRAAPDESFDFVFTEGPQEETPAPLEFAQMDFPVSSSTEPAESHTSATDSTTPPPRPEPTGEPEIRFQPEEVLPTMWGEYRPFIIAGISTLALTLALTVGYFAIKGKPGDHERLGIQNLKTPGEEEKGSFTIKSTEAYYVKNSQAGELFVIKASAVNNYNTPRIGIEAQASLLDKNGKPLDKKQAYCNAELNEEDLSTLPYEEITEKLSEGPSDDPMENTPTEPGKSAACMVVFQNVPKEAVEYGIEIIHSQSEKLEEF